jgi:dihydroxyacetone kinase-like predicted kinase
LRARPLVPGDGITLQTKVAANAQAMKRWLGKAETALGNHSDRLNAINIFPVADGDTGTNLYLTVRAAARALRTDASAHADTFQREPVKQESFKQEPFQKERVRKNPVQKEPGQVDVGAVLALAGQAALEQARGNSGTLFSVFLCAAAEPLAGHTRLTSTLLAAALNRAQIRAWSALSDPVPGTMLSVMEAAARSAAAVDAGQNGDDSNHALGLALDAAVEGALAAVVRTEGQLDALRTAHVVDAGGVGMLLILDCLRSAVLGEELQSELLDGLHGYDVQDPHIHNDMPDDDGVEVMCTISLSPLNAATLRQRLDEIGESVIMSQVGATADQDGNYRWRVHVHTPDADPAVRLFRSLGDPTNITVSELALPRDPEEDPVNSNGYER